MFKKIEPFFAMLAMVASVYAVEPDFIRTFIYNVDGGGSNLVSTVYSGFGREVQSKFRITNEKDRVISIFYDELNRKKITTKPFIDTVHEGYYLPGGFDSVNNFLKETYSAYDKLSGDPFAYSEARYYCDQSGRVKSTGSPGIHNCIGSGHENRSWYYTVSLNPATISLTQGTVLFADGLIKNLTANSGYDTADVLDNLYGYLMENHSVLSPRSHFLSVSMDPAGAYIQKLDDELGRTVSVWSDPDNTVDNEIISRTRYDFYGNPIEEIAPVNLLNPSDTVLIENSKYLYNTLGQMIRRETPDGAVDSILYDKSGRDSLILSWTLRPNATRDQYERTDLFYDVFGRRTGALKYRKGVLVSSTISFYDNTDALTPFEGYYTIPSGILHKLTNLNNKLVCSIAFNFVDSKTYKVVDLYSYNDEGEVSQKYKIVPGLPLQEISYAYDIHGKILDERVACGKDTVVKRYIYDSYGRACRVIHQNNGAKELVRFTYNDLGKTTAKTLDSIHDIEYLYTIQDQIKRIESSGPAGFREDISYLRNSNIDTVKSVYKGMVSDSFTNVYSYDNVSRLLAVNSSKPEYNSGYSYDQAGRFRTKEEGSSVISGYTYHQKTNRLRYAKDAIRDYVYDQRGNLIVDRFKNMVILYNGDNLPVQFKFYKSIPDAVTADSRGTAVLSDTTFTGNIYQYMDQISAADLDFSLISRVTMLYDASGNRVLKMENLQ